MTALVVGLPPGAMIDGFKVIKALGDGGFAFVYLVEKNGKLYALKVARHREASGDDKRTHARTLREWRQRFDAAFNEHVRPALLSDHKAIRELPAEAQAREVEVFRKKWTYYFVYCEVGFTERVIGGEWSGGLLPLSLCSHTTRADHILSFTREGNTSLPTCCG